MILVLNVLTEEKNCSKNKTSWLSNELHQLHCSCSPNSNQSHFMKTYPCFHDFHSVTSIIMMAVFHPDCLYYLQ